MSETVKVEDRVARWQQVVHALAREKGWHDDPAIPRRFQMLGNVMVEVGEMWEEARAKDFDAKRIYCLVQRYVERDGTFSEGKVDYAQREEIQAPDQVDLKPLGFPTELADVVIRVLDTAGALGIEMWDRACVSITERENPDLWKQMCLLMYDVADMIEASELLGSLLGAQDELHSCMAYALARCEAIAKVAGVDLWRAVEIKHAYNQTRSHRHGGKRS